MSNTSGNTVLVYGPQQSGKTFHAEALRVGLGCDSVVDEYGRTADIAPIPGGLHLTNLSVRGMGLAVGAFDSVLSIEMACTLLGLPQLNAQRDCDHRAESSPADPAGVARRLRASLAELNGCVKELKRSDVVTEVLYRNDHGDVAAIRCNYFEARITRTTVEGL